MYENSVNWSDLNLSWATRWIKLIKLWLPHTLPNLSGGKNFTQIFILLNWALYGEFCHFLGHRNLMAITDQNEDLQYLLEFGETEENLDSLENLDLKKKWLKSFQNDDFRHDLMAVFDQSEIYSSFKNLSWLRRIWTLWRI